MELNIEELKARLLRQVEMDNATTCWNWTGSKDLNGYGMIGIKRIKFRTHKLSYLLFVGDVPAESCVCHHCDNPSCVNPLHLFLGSRKLNSQDMSAKKRHHKPQLTLDEVRTLRREFVEMDGVASEKYRALAERYGYSVRGILRILQQKVYSEVRDVPRPILNRVKESAAGYMV